MPGSPSRGLWRGFILACQLVIVLTMIVDAHTHIFPPQVLAHRHAFLEGEPAFAAIYASPKAHMLDGPGLLAAMDKDGVDISWALGFPWVQEEHACLHNDYLLQAVADSGGRLRGLGCVHPPAGWALPEARRCLQMGLSGLGELAFYDSDLDLNSLAPLCQLCAQADRPLLLHTNEPVGHRYPGKSPMNLTTLYQLIRDHGRTKLVLAHMGGGIFLYSLLKREVNQSLQNVWLDTAAGPFLYGPRAYALAVELMGPGKLLLGSDHPLLPVSRYQQELEQAGLVPEDLKQILGLTALDLIP
ncbi:Amidohydrolase family protein [Desulfarculales bacterium]